MHSGRVRPIASSTKPRPAEAPHLSLPEIQHPMIEAYLDALPQGRAPRILASCTVFVADDRKEAMRLAEIGLARQRARYATIGRTVFVEGMSVLDQTSRSLVPLTTHTRECRATAPQRERSLLRADSPAEETGFEPSVPLGSGSAGKVERRRLDKWIPLAGDQGFIPFPPAGSQFSR